MMRTSRTSNIQCHAPRTRSGPRRRRKSARGGFTLLEVMLALSILAVALVGLIGRTTSNIRISEEVAMQGVVTELVRGKMYDIEEELLRDGFQELDQSSEGEFDEEGWPAIRWEAKVEKIELPNLGSLESMGQGEGQAGEGGEAGAGGMLGGLLSMGGMGGTGGGDDGTGDMSMEFISSQYEILREVMEQAIRKVTLTATWKVGNEDKEMVVACYFTDPAAIGRVLPGAGGIGGGVGGGTGGVGGGSGGRTGGVVGGGGSGRGGDEK